MDTVCCVYKIQHKLDFDGEDFYIGSTKNFHRRKGEHKFKCKDSNIPLYKYIRDNGGFYNFEITISNPAVILFSSPKQALGLL